MGEFVIRQGDGRTFRLPVVDGTGDPFDITGYTFLLALATAPGETPAVQVSGNIIDAEGGIVEFALTPTHTATRGTYYYEAQGTSPGSIPYTLDWGRMFIVLDIA